MAFPSPRLDVLDESEKAMAFLQRPENDNERMENLLRAEESVLSGLAGEEDSGYDDDNQFGY